MWFDDRELFWLLVRLLVVGGIVGWAVIEFALWLFAHVRIVWVQ